MLYTAVTMRTGFESMMMHFPDVFKKKICHRFQKIYFSRLFLISYRVERFANDDYAFSWCLFFTNDPFTQFYLAFTILKTISWKNELWSVFSRLQRWCSSVVACPNFRTLSRFPLSSYNLSTYKIQNSCILCTRTIFVLYKLKQIN